MEWAVSERWLPVVGYEGAYEVSDKGRVRSLDRVNARGHRLRGRELRPGKHSRGYLVVNLAGPEGIRQHLAHRLVLDAFVGPQPEKHALHWNDVPDDNRLDNLRWGTPSDNGRDSVRNGSNYFARKTHCPRGHELAGENLVASKLRLGYRECRACRNARAHCARLGIPFATEVADDYAVAWRQG